MLLIELVRRCEGLDSADPELARYALDLHELGPKNIIVVPDDPTHIVRRPFSPPPFFLYRTWRLSRIPLPPSWLSSIGNPLPSDSCGAVRARRTGSCPRSWVTTTHASNGCAVLSARRWRMNQSLPVQSTWTIPATLWTRWQSTAHSAMVSWCCQLCRACTFCFLLWLYRPVRALSFSLARTLPAHFLSVSVSRLAPPSVVPACEFPSCVWLTTG